VGLSEELEPFPADQHDRVQRGRVLRRQAEAIELSSRYSPVGERQPGVTIGQTSTPTKVRSRSESLSRPPFRAWSFVCQ
jgi:hypothetical protein